MAHHVEPARTRTDSFADGLDFPDTGCETGGPSCLACPLARCVHDVPGGKRTMRVSTKAVEARALRNAGLGVGAIAERLGVSRRQVFRFLKGR